MTELDFDSYLTLGSGPSQTIPLQSQRSPGLTSGPGGIALKRKLPFTLRSPPDSRMSQPDGLGWALILERGQG